MEKLQFNLNPSKRGDTKKERDFEEIVRNRNISSTEYLILNRIIRRTDVKYLIQFHMKAGNDLSTHNPHGYSALPRLSENIHKPQSSICNKTSFVSFITKSAVLKCHFDAAPLRWVRTDKMQGTEGEV